MIISQKQKMEKLTQLKAILSSIEGDAQKFYKSANNAAGTRLRKAMLEIKNLTQEVRKEVSSLKEKIKAQKVDS